MNKYEGYKKLLVDSLVENYHLTKDEAAQAVEQSAVCKMLSKESTANWQMHQPLRSTVEEIYNDFEGNFLIIA